MRAGGPPGVRRRVAPWCDRGLVLVTCLAMCVLAACSSVPPSTTTGLRRLDVIPGQTLLIPMDSTWGDASARRASGRLDTGASVEGAVYTLGVRVDLDPTLERAARWLPPPGVWSSLDRASARSAPVEASLRVLALDLPSVAGDAPHVLRIMGKDFALQFLPKAKNFIDPIKADSLELGDPWTPTIGSAGAVSPLLIAFAWPEAQSPIGRWRYRLMSGTLRPEFDPPPFDIITALKAAPSEPSPGAGETAGGAVGGLAPFEDPVVEALARQNEARWRVAIAKLWATDADLASRVKRRLAGVVDFGNGYVAPAWCTDHASIDQLQSDILDPNLDSTQRVWRVESWLSLQPSGVAWVIDDSGTLDELTGKGIGTVGVANLGDASTLAWASTKEAETGSLTPLPARSARRLSIEPSRPGPGAPDSSTPWRPASVAPPTRPATMHAGRWQQSVSLVEGRVPVTPPSFRLGPLLPDYTMATWLSNAPASPRPEWLTAAMLHRLDAPAPAPSSSTPNSAASPTWELYIECLSPRPDLAPQQDVVRVWIGPLGAPLAVLRIDATGQIADEARRADLLKTPTDVRVVRTGDRWSFRLALPTGVIEKDGTLRLGLTRETPTGSRSAWPRPMLPWQDEPGRLALDTRGWGE